MPQSSCKDRYELLIKHIRTQKSHPEVFDLYGWEMDTVPGASKVNIFRKKTVSEEQSWQQARPIGGAACAMPMGP